MNTKFISLLYLLQICLFAQTYTYDQSGHLIGVKYSDEKEIGYKYDESGNILNITKVAIENSGTVTVVDSTDQEEEDISTPETPKKGDSSPICFVATAAFGSYLHKDVVVLRNFRDDYLLTNTIGTFLVEDVYYKYSPPIANYIASNEILRTVTRWLLTPIIYSAKYPVVFLLFPILVLLTIQLKRKKLVKS